MTRQQGNFSCIGLTSSESMLELSGKLHSVSWSGEPPRRLLVKVVTNPEFPKVLATEAAFLCTSPVVPDGFRLYIALQCNRRYLDGVQSEVPTVVLPDSAMFLR